MAKKKYTTEEREQVNARRAKLVEAAKKLEESHAADIELAAQILGTYSRRNIALILAQAGERGREIPQAVAGFHEWRKAGRIIRKGSKGYFIFAPMIRKDDAGEDTKTGYRVAHVFDIADTDPITEDAPATLRELVLSEDN